MRASATLLFTALLAHPLHAQRIYQRGSDLLLEETPGHLRSLGTGFNPIPISDHKFLLIRGVSMTLADKSTCEHPNRIVLYDTKTRQETPVFAKPLAPIPDSKSCSYQQADLSPSGSILYIITPCEATSGCLAIVNLPTGRIKYIPGAMDVFVIRGGADSGDLIYMSRLPRQPTARDPRPFDYAYIHARPDGAQVSILSTESLASAEEIERAPILRTFLRSVAGRIFVQGRWIP